MGWFTTLHVATLLRSLGWFTTLHVATLLRSLGWFTTLHFATLLRSLGWGGVGWGGMGGHVHVPCTSYMIYCYAAEIFGMVYYVTCCYAAEIFGMVYYVTCCYAAEIFGMVYYVTCYYACVAAMRLQKENAPQFFQAFQSSNWHGTVVKSTFLKAMTLKTEKTRPKFFQDFQSSNWHGTMVKSPFFKKMCVLWERFPVRRDVYEPPTLHIPCFEHETYCGWRKSCTS